MGADQLTIIDIGDPYAVESFPIKDSLIALDTSAIIKIASPTSVVSDFVKMLALNNNTLVIPYKAYEELRINCDPEPERKSSIVSTLSRDAEFSNATITANGIIAKIEDTGILYEEFIDMDPKTKVQKIDRLGQTIPLRWPDLTIVATALEHGVTYLWSHDSDFGLVAGSGLTLITESRIFTKIQNNGVNCVKFVKA